MNPRRFSCRPLATLTVATLVAVAWGAAANAADEIESLSVTMPRLSPPIAPPLHVSSTGLGSLYWAANHPAQAWEILLPVQPTDPTGAYADIREQCRVIEEFDQNAPPCL